MAEENAYKSFTASDYCVIIPTYNNERTLGSVIQGVMEFTTNIIVVNDGSTDNTRRLVQKFPGIKSLRYSKNKGKGFALRQGFKEARKQGYRYAITIDSDGQHLPEDLPRFLEMLETNAGALIIGARNMGQAGIPEGSAFGNSFSNFWTWVETGYHLPDTQSGYRLYPIEKYAKTQFFTNRFEFEIEILVRSAWKGIPLVSVPVSVIYPSKEERVSHFRPFIDFTRISILNSILVILALLVFRPWMIIRKMSQQGFREVFRKHLLNPEESNFKKAASIAVGVFMGIAPVWGWQMAIALTLAFILKLNKAITLVASNISIPPAIPFILFASYFTGGWILGNQNHISFDDGITLEFVSKNLLQYVVGALAFGTVMALLAGSVTWILLSIFRKK